MTALDALAVIAPHMRALRQLLNDMDEALAKFHYDGDPEQDIDENQYPYYDEAKADWNEAIYDAVGYLLDAYEGKEKV